MVSAKTSALDDAATTVALLEADAVIGVRATVENGVVTSAGITCALCHVNAASHDFELESGTVALPIGAPQYDGKPNAAMDAGASTVLAKPVSRKALSEKIAYALANPVPREAARPARAASND